MKNIVQPPKWIDRLIDNLAPVNLAEEIKGDLYEMFLKDVAGSGISKARAVYVIRGMGFLLQSFFWKRSTITNNSLMFSSYFSMAIRSLKAHRATTAINVLGLIIGIAAALAILDVIRFELSFDKFHTHSDQIYRVVRVSGPDLSEFRSGVSYPVADALQREIPSLEHVVRMEYFGGANVEVQNSSGSTVRRFREESGFTLVDTSFLKVFDFKNAGLKWIAGDINKALTEPFTIVLTSSIAKKYFGDSDPIGQTLKLQGRYDCSITGVIADFPANTDFPFTVLISYASIPKIAGEEYNNWVSVHDSNHLYVVLSPGATPEDIEKQIAQVHAGHTDKELHESRHYLLQRLDNVHFDPKFGNYSGRTITMETIVGLGLIGLFLILTASINYVNLATAQASLRTREIGVRKVLGGNQKNLILQFLTETFILVVFSAIAAWTLSKMVTLNLETLVDLKVTGYNFADPFGIGVLLILIAALTLLAGFYPAIVIAGTNPVKAMKTKFSTENLSGISLRKVLVIVQFTITQILVVGTYIVINQMEYFQTVDMGFNQQGIVTTRIPNQNASTLTTLEDKLRSQPFIQYTSYSFTLPSGAVRNRSYADIGKPEANAMSEFIVFEYVPVDESYLTLYGIKLLAGRQLEMSDSLGNILINRTLVKNLELGTPQDAIGAQLKMGSDLVTVVGVIDDYFSNSLKEQADNIAMLIKPDSYSALSIKLHMNGQDKSISIPDAVKKIEEIWSASFPDFIFSYRFLDDNIDAFYKQEQKYAKLFKIFSVIFLLIGCLGLYGLITFVVNRKVKEVAIRKVLGATLTSILLLFSKDYVKLIVLSFVIAVPVAYYLINDWLNSFANHIPLQWWLFTFPGLIVLLIAVLVVIAKTLGTANSNPVDKLKYE